MLFPTAEFAVFFLAVFALNWLLMPYPRLWKAFMAATGLFFYGLWDYRFVALLVASILANQMLVVAGSRPGASPRARKGWVAASVAANLAVLAFFKFYGFFVNSLADGLGGFGVEASLPLLELIVPAGISFLTFRAITYAVDVYRGEVKPVPLADAAVYFSFFPYMLAGPIVRASEFMPQLASPRDARSIDASRAFFLITVGLVKKVVIADFLARSLVNGVFDNPAAYSSVETLVGMYAYAVQIFCDFSGYTDIAIGLALLLGFRLPDNFNAPYTATSLQDFWRRWHMTLSRFLRDYLYIPLGGNRGSEWRVARNIMITMLLGGMWHGAGWTFVVWGGLHGVGLVAERFFRRRTGSLSKEGAKVGGERWRRLAGRVAVFHYVCLLWVFFRVETLEGAGRVFARVAEGVGGLGAITPAVVLAVLVGIAGQYTPRPTLQLVQARFSRLNLMVQGLVLGVAVFLIDAFGPEGVADFIYFRF